MTRENRGRALVHRYLASVVLFSMSSALVATAHALTGPALTAGPQRSSMLKRGKEPLEIVGKIVAMSQEPIIESLDGSADILLVKIEKTLSGKAPGHYVRADFVNQKVIADPEERRQFRKIQLSLPERKTWKIRLRPSRGTAECAWTIPPAPRPGEEIGIVAPIIVPVGESKRYPDINTLFCYAFGQKDIEAISPTD